MIWSVGRLIHWTPDKGIMVLVGKRFADAEVNELLPDYWFQNPGDVVVVEKYEKEIQLFCKKMEEFYWFYLCLYIK